MSKVRHLRPGLRSGLLGSLAVAALLAAAPASAASPRPVDIPAGSLEASLAALSAQTGDQLMFPPELVQGRTAPAVSGRLSTEEALRRLLASDDIIARRVGPRMVVLKPTTERRPASDGPARAGGAPSGPFDATPGGAGPRLVDSPNPPQIERAPTHTLEELRVTGTLVRGARPREAPGLVLDREDLLQSGHATLAGALNTLPQVFGGRSTETTSLLNSDRSGTNGALATGVNLRGLGSDATLVLVDGRRLAGSGLKGDFADVSSIPSIAIERVEILLDGASALYGSDAVGGVVNIILRDDFEGGQLRARAGAATAGEPREGLVAGLIGHRWGTGSVLLAAEAYQREALAAADRPFTATADLRPSGGHDWRLTFAAPGNILRLDPVTRVTSPFWGIPSGQPGVGLQPGDFLAGQLNYDNPRAGQDVLPAQRRISLVANLRQEVGVLELQADARYSTRRSKAEIRAQTATLTVSRSNPFFVSPNGSTSHQITYSFGDDLGSPVTRPGSDSLSLVLAAAAPLPRDWRLDAYAAFAQEIQETGSSGQINSALLQEALGNVADRPETGYSPQRDGYFNPFSGLPNQRAAVLGAIGSGFSDARTVTRVTTGNAQADGAVLNLPGGALKLALGGQVRREELVRNGSNYTSTVAPVAIASADVGRTVAAAFAEARAPLFGADNARPGFRSLELSGAVRVERYSDFGTTANPKAGATWVPVQGLNVRATYGHSFRAPALTELNDTQLYSAAQFPLGTGRILGLLLQGGNADLEPETAKTWTLGADLQPAAIAGLRLSATWFETAFQDRIDQPARQNLTGVLSDPSLSPFVRRIQPDSNAADLQLITGLLADPAAASAGLFPPQDYRAIVDARLVNTGRLTVRGLDLQAIYARPLAGGDLSLSANASWLFDYVQQLTPTSAAVDRSGQAGYPADLRARLAADWTRGPLTTGLALNHMGDLDTPDGRGIDSLTTVDFRLRLKGDDGARFRGVALDLTVRNLFDADPPFYDNPDGFAFDPANADVIGRFVSLELSRSW